ncbi:MAG TPA: hypothetical protein VIU61_26280 [Kofleriaceae bacterium]
MGRAKPHSRAWLVTTVVITACASRVWRPAVVGELHDPAARTVVLGFGDGQNGTQIVLELLEQAKAARVSAISNFALQVGSCTRSIESDGQPVAATRIEPVGDAPRPDDLIVVRARETRYSCTRVVRPAPSTSGAGDGRGQPQLARTPSVESKDCRLLPIDGVVMRHRNDLDHRFAPPDWAEVAKQAGVQLRFGPMRCDGPPSSELRARFHQGVNPPATAAAQPAILPTPDTISALVERAQAAALARRPDEAVELAHQAITASAATDVLASVDEPHREQLAGTIAHAYFLTGEVEVDKLARRIQAREIDQGWATEVGAGLDRVAMRYLRITDLVRVPSAVPWLRAAEARLAELHLHVAARLELAGETTAAEREREKARALTPTPQ